MFRKFLLLFLRGLTPQFHPWKMLRICQAIPWELLNALLAAEQRRLMRQEGTIEGGLQARHQYGGKGKKNKSKKNMVENDKGVVNDNNNNSNKGRFPPCQHCKGK